MAGLPLYLELVQASGLAAAIRRHVHVAGAQDRLEQNRGQAALAVTVERALLTRPERRSLKARWRRERQRTVPSASSVLDWLQRFHDLAAPKAVAGTAYIPAVTPALQSLWQVNQALPGFGQ